MSEIKEFSFSEISLNELDTMVQLDEIYNLELFKEWFSEITIRDSDLYFLKELNSQYGENRSSFFREASEETLKAKFIVPILNRVKFFSEELGISDFYHERLIYKTSNFYFNGHCDFFVAKGLIRPKNSLFFIQEFKRGRGEDPLAQLIAGLIAGLENSHFQQIRGAFFAGSIWNFVILYKNKDINNYKFVVSQNFDSSKLDDLKKIFSNLLFVKNEIFNFITHEQDSKKGF
jgi:hypothetical protein